VIVLSTEINDNVDSIWMMCSFTTPDHVGRRGQLPQYSAGLPTGAAKVGEGVTWTGDVALTSPNAKFDMSNLELYAQVGVVARVPVR